MDRIHDKNFWTDCGRSVFAILLSATLTYCTVHEETTTITSSSHESKQNQTRTAPSHKAATYHKNAAHAAPALNKVSSVSGNPEASEINVQLGMGYLRKGDVARAQMKFQQAVAQSPTDPTALNALAYFYSHTSQREKAKHYYQLALKKNPHSGLAHNNYGVFLCQHDQQPEAIRHFIAATEDSHYLKSAEAFENAGLCAIKINQVARAWQYFQLAHQRDPQRETVLLELARLSYQSGKLSQAQRYLQAYEKIAGVNAVSSELSQRIAHDTKTKAITG